MSENKSNKGLGLTQTKGTFQVRGIVSGMLKDKAYVEQQTKTNKLWRSINFGVKYSPEETLFVRLNGMEQENVYFSKKNDQEGKPNVTKKVPWRERFTFEEEGFALIGKRLGVERVKDEKGQEVNQKTVLVDYDACKKLNDNLKDGQTVFVKGDIEYSEYNGKHQTTFVPNQVSLGKDIDFESEDFKAMSKFTQNIVYMGIKKDPNEECEYIIDAKIVTYKTIEDAEFRTKNPKLAKNLDEKIKPYTGMKIFGDIVTEQNTEEVTVKDDGWGEENEMEKQSQPMIRKLIVTGVDPESFDTHTYSKEIIEKALEKVTSDKVAKEDFGSDDGWGSVGSEDMDSNLGWD